MELTICGREIKKLHLIYSYAMEQIKLTINSYLQRISKILMINGGFLVNPGLFSGEMGVVVFFARYARLTQNELYLDYSSDLIKAMK